MTTPERILAHLVNWPGSSDGDMATALHLPEPSVRRSRKVLERTKRIRYAGARYEPHATIQTWSCT